MPDEVCNRKLHRINPAYSGGHDLTVVAWCATIVEGSLGRALLPERSSKQPAAGRPYCPGTWSEFRCAEMRRPGLMKCKSNISIICQNIYPANQHTNCDKNNTLMCWVSLLTKLNKKTITSGELFLIQQFPQVICVNLLFSMPL